MDTVQRYDVAIVGAGIAGSSLAHALANLRPADAPPLKIILLERSLAEPDRIVGELLQPGGMKALRSLGLEWCTEEIGAIPVHGYAVVYNGETVEIPYPDKEEGWSFHHGRFVMRLREAAKKARNVDVIEAAVNDLIECPLTDRILGVRATRKGAESSECFFADVTICADGCFSKFRSIRGEDSRKPDTRSHFVGLILKDAKLPLAQHGTVALMPGRGPVLLYQIEEHDTRMLVDVKLPLPKDMKAYLEHEIVPFLPANLQSPILESLTNNRIRTMPNSFLPAAIQSGNKEGVFLLGDAWNMRHPLTGGGMTVALADVAKLMELLRPLANPVPSLPDEAVVWDAPFSDWSRISGVLSRWHWSRKPVSSTVNILSVALYDLFGAEGEDLHILREGCFKYFERGGECVNGPVSLLSVLAPRPFLLLYHFFSVAFYSIRIMFTLPKPRSRSPSPKPHSDSDVSECELDLEMVKAGFTEYPWLFWRGLSVLWTACIVFGPLLWSEVRWW